MLNFFNDVTLTADLAQQYNLSQCLWKSKNQEKGWSNFLKDFLGNQNFWKLAKGEILRQDLYFLFWNPLISTFYDIAIKKNSVNDWKWFLKSWCTI